MQLQAGIEQRHHRERSSLDFFCSFSVMKVWKNRLSNQYSKSTAKMLLLRLRTKATTATWAGFT